MDEPPEETLMKRHGTTIVILGFVVLASLFGTVRFDVDEFKCVKEPYEMFGGDYTVGYLQAHEYGNALDCAGRSYRFFWHYRPIWSPVISERDRTLFAREEQRFGYVKPDQPKQPSLQAYARRMIVPEPDRFYRHGAGAPLLAQLTRIPSLVLLRLFSNSGRDLLHLQFNAERHWMFLLARIQGVIAGVLCLLLVHRILVREGGPGPTWLGVALLASIPTALYSFPNLHFDSTLAPFILLTATWFVQGRHVPAGLAFGLALASKTSAVFLLPAAIAYVAWELSDARRTGGPDAFAAGLRRRGAGLALFCLFGLVALAPFGNPVSVAQELLTPFTDRPFDPRGEDVSSISLAKRLSADGTLSDWEPQRPLVVMIKNLIGYNLPMLLLLLGLPLVWSRIRRPTSRIGFLFFLISFPYSIIYGDSLGYRALMFLPFFALIAAEVLVPRVQAAIVAAFLVLSLIFVMDPIGSTGLPHVRQAPSNATLESAPPGQTPNAPSAETAPSAR